MSGQQTPETVAENIINEAAYLNCLHCRQPCIREIRIDEHSQPFMPGCYLDENQESKKTRDYGELPSAEQRWASLEESLGKIPAYQDMKLRGEEDPTFIALSNLIKVLKDNSDPYFKPICPWSD